MRRSLKQKLICVLYLTAAACGTACGPPEEAKAPAPPAPKLATGDVIPGRYIVALKDGTTGAPDQMATMPMDGVRVAFVYDHALKGFAGEMTADKAATLGADPRVAAIISDRVVAIADGMTSGPPVHAKGGGGGTTDAIPHGVERANADIARVTGAGVHVAIIDTGVAPHPDLPVLEGGINCADDGVDDHDLFGHGTHVAGIIGARKNGIGIVGVAPDTHLWSVRVLNAGGSGSDSAVICGIDFVAAHAPGNGGPIKVANMSLGRWGSSDNDCGLTNHDLMHQAICRARDAGVTFVVAAGNSSSDASGFIPAAYHDAVITVSALADSDGRPFGEGAATSYGPDDTFATFSNYGVGVDLGAPGVDIYSTWLGCMYQVESGTSMASPHVTGGVALYYQLRPAAHWTEARDALRSVGERPGFLHTNLDGKHPEPVLNLGSF